MIAASQEFLDQIRPLSTERAYLRAAALLAGYRFDRDWHKYGFYQLPVSNHDTTATGLSHWLVSAVSDPSEFQVARVNDVISEGMPLIGWAWNCDSRRITGAANPGEGDFHKHVGRAAE